MSFREDASDLSRKGSRLWKRILYCEEVQLFEAGEQFQLSEVVSFLLEIIAKCLGWSQAFFLLVECVWDAKACALYRECSAFLSWSCCCAVCIAWGVHGPRYGLKMTKAYMHNVLLDDVGRCLRVGLTRWMSATV